MNRTKILAFGALAVVALVILLLASRNRHVPYIPEGDVHPRGMTNAECEACHGPDGDWFRGRNHPIGSDCYRCHAFER